jgi:hypothetical protein
VAAMELAFSNTQHDKENWQQFVENFKYTNKPADRQVGKHNIISKILKALVDKVAKHE